MFDLGASYAEFTESPSAFWTEDVRLDYISLLDDSPTTILDETVWPDLVGCMCPPPETNEQIAVEFVGFLSSQVKRWSKFCIQKDYSLAECREATEKYFFLIRVHLARLEREIEPQKSKISQKPLNNNEVQQIITLLQGLSYALRTSIPVLFPEDAKAKRITLSLLYLDPSCRLLQNSLVVKNVNLLTAIITLLCLSVTEQSLDQVLKKQIVQLLGYYEHATKAVVALLKELSLKYHNFSLAQEVLMDVAEEASTWTDTQNSAITAKAKSVSEFLTELGRECPLIVAENVQAFRHLVNSPVPQLRQAVLELVPIVVGVLLRDYANSASNSDTNASNNVDMLNDFEFDQEKSIALKPVFELVDIAEQRVNDASHYCRVRAIRALAGFCDEPALLKRHSEFAKIAVMKMKDRTQRARVEGVNLMIKVMQTHPTLIHPQNFNKQLWESSLTEIDSQLDATTTLDTVAIQQFEAAKEFIVFTLKIIDYIDEAMLLASSLLSSNSKTDNLSSINLLVHADAYDVQSSKQGIKAIVHLVWAKVENDENNDVCKTAVSTYVDLFMTAPPMMSTHQSARYIADNLIKLVLNANTGELVSLQELIKLALEQDAIHATVISKLWATYQHAEAPAKIRQGSALVLSMLASADESIAKSGIGSVTSVGLDLNLPDILLATYSCSILKFSIAPASTQRLPANFNVFKQIIDMLLVPCDKLEWMNLAKEALAAIYTMCEVPSKVYTQLLLAYMDRVFGEMSLSLSQESRQKLFSQMIYVSGEVALNILLYLDRSEREFKQKTQNSRDQQNTAEAEENGDFQGTYEDDFMDIIESVREEGILYSDRALLKPLAQVVVSICEAEMQSALGAQEHNGGAGNDPIDPIDNPTDDPIMDPIRDPLMDPIMDPINGEPNAPPHNKGTVESLGLIAATQTLCKFMCASPRFCKEQIPLFLNLMSLHPSHIVRSNFVIAVGDIAVSFNQLIDGYTESIFSRLQDPDSSVQRTSIIALTFLILAGQIKVKGQLGEMAKSMASKDRKISTLSTMFFRELSTKENAIYNGFLDMLSTLIADEQLDENDMMKILKFLASFITKQQNIKNITDRLTKRMPRASSQREWNAYVTVLRGLPGKLDDDVKELIARKYQGMAGIDEDDEEDSDEDNLESPGRVSQAVGSSAPDSSAPGATESTPGAHDLPGGMQLEPIPSINARDTQDIMTDDLSLAVGDMSIHN